MEVYLEMNKLMLCTWLVIKDIGMWFVRHSIPMFSIVAIFSLILLNLSVAAWINPEMVGELTSCFFAIEVGIIAFIIHIHAKCKEIS